MKTTTTRLQRCLLAVSVLVLLLPGLNSWGQTASSPDDRVVTEPQSIQSQSNASAHPIPIDDLYFTRGVGGPSWSPDGKQIAFSTTLSGRENLWKVNSSGGWPIQLAQSDDRQSNAAWSPDGKWIVFQQDAGGNELYDLYAVPADGGEIVNLTATPEIREQSPQWSPDGKSIALEYKPQASTVYDIAVLDWNSRKVRKLTNEETRNHIWSVVAWSRDGKTVYANRTETSFTDADVYSIDAGNGKFVNLTPHSGKVLIQATSLSPNGRSLLLTSTEKGGYSNVALLDLSSGKTRWVTNTQWEAHSGNFSPDGLWFTYTINQDGQNDAYLVDRTSNRAEKLSIPAGLNYFAGDPIAFSPDSTRVLVSHESSVQPGDLYVYDLAKRHATQLTYSAIASLTAAPMPPSQIVHYKSFDGRTISALLWVPFNLKRDGSNPALLLPHGGPTGQTIDSFNPDLPALVSRGYICIAPNVRGSTGYGMAFQKANYQDLGGGDLQDEVFATKFLTATGYVDAKKIGITGGSYGGYMTLMAIGRTPDVWAAAVELYGIIDWYTMLQHEDPMLQEYEKSLLGDPEKDRQVYETASPITFIHAAKAPLLVLQGENDPRVPKEEAEQVVSLLKKDGKTVDAHYYPAEGHGFEKRENQIDSIRRTIAWFDKYLKNE
jgi:dipeptidyl aminopeptidase/acylaminoacyl peptidase